MIVKLNKKTRKNLKLLRDGLRKGHADYLTNFDMSFYWYETDWYREKNAEGSEYFKKNACGTDACLLGHTVLIEGLGPTKALGGSLRDGPDWISMDNGPDWIAHGNKLFPSVARNSGFSFLFNSHWPNNIDKAIERIDWLLEGKEIDLYDFSKVDK